MTLGRTQPTSQPTCNLEDLRRQSNAPWSPWGLLGFRLAASYLTLSWFTVYGVLQVLPWIGFRLEGAIEHLWAIPVQWIGVHIFHLTGIAAHPHASDSRDTAINWTTAALVFPVSILSATIWSVLDRNRRDYQRASEWLRYVLRLALIFLMLRYALMKIYPLQMLPPSLAVLSEPLGNTSPMTLLWTTIGLHPEYEMVAGWIEAAAALLLFFRRTALLGALLTILVMSNVLLYNLFFDVPVKLGAANMLLLAIAVASPDLQVLWQLFVRHQPVSLTSRWAPDSRRRGVRISLRVVELLFFGFALIQFLPTYAGAYRDLRTNLRNPSPLTGQWHVDSVLRKQNGTEVSLPVLTGLGQPMIDVTIEPTGMVMARAADGMLWRAEANVDLAKHTVELSSGYFHAPRFDATYDIQQSDSDHLILNPLGEAAARNGVMRLSRVRLPTHYPLLDERFHWVNEWALER